MPKADIAKLAVPVAAVLGLLYYYWSTNRKVKALLDKTRKKVQILAIENVSHDTKRVRLSTGHPNRWLGLPIGKHIRLYAPNPKASQETGKWNGRDDDESKSTEIRRSYTPTPVDRQGYCELVMKIYRPGTVTMPDGKKMVWENGGKMSQYVDSLKTGDWIEIDGPVGHIEYLGFGKFKLPGQTRETKHVGMMAGGTGITPMLQVVANALELPGDDTCFSLIYANKKEDDILVQDLLEEYVQRSAGRFKIFYTLDFPPEGWQHKKGFITAEMIRDCLPPKEKNPLIFMCGPPPMVEFACKKNLESLGYDKNTYHAF